MVDLVKKTHFDLMILNSMELEVLLMLSDVIVHQAL